MKDNFLQVKKKEHVVGDGQGRVSRRISNCATRSSQRESPKGRLAKDHKANR